MTSESLLTAARSGDEAAFEQLVEPHRRALQRARTIVDGACPSAASRSPCARSATPA
jgi:hypothetical protein